MEPLLRCLLTNAGINGIHIHSKEYKIVTFADDLMLFLSDPLISLPNLIKDFKMFGSLSNLKINYSKSYALNVCLFAPRLGQPPINYPSPSCGKTQHSLT